jgi:hypothetical protein
MSNRLVPWVVLAAVVAVSMYVGHLLTTIAHLQQDIASLKAKPSAAAAPTAAAPRQPIGPARTLPAGARQALLDTLREETGPVKKVWLRVDPNDAEASGYAKALLDVFREAGWEVQQLGSDGLMFKPGVYVLVAEDEWPSYAETANKALEAAGVGVTAARGYRAYYEEQKKEKPGWRGTEFLPDQTYVVLVGRKPEAKPES